MKALKIVLYSLLSLILVVVAAGLILISSVSRGALPLYEGETSIKGLSQEVTVYRDERGMPHIYAANDKDLYFAVGYVMAQERLWQMDLIRRATIGRLSEIFGRDYVQTDLFLRSLDMTAKSERVLEYTEPEILSCLESFCMGINSYLSGAGKKLPPEFRILGYRPDPWKPSDMLNVVGYMGWDLANGNLSSELFNYRLLEKLGEEKAVQLVPDWKAAGNVVYPGFSLDEKTLKDAAEFIKGMEKVEAMGITVFSGSNNWALSGKRTAAGKPLLANDMHLSIGSPGIWIQMHQVIPGKLNVTGVVVPGQPFVICGHNEKIAWGMTNLMVDDIDLYAEKINPSDSNQYFFEGEWKDMLLREEVIKVKDDSAQKLMLRFTHRGPVISRFRNISGSVLSMRWSGYDMSNEVKTVYRLNRASNWEEFRDAISNFRTTSQNIVYADTEGNIGLNIGGGIPLRKGSGSFVRNGETGDYDWKGYVPFDQMPSSFNPAEGFVSSANNKTVDDSYPYYISDGFALPYRINRIRQMIGEKEVMDTDDFIRMIHDQHSDYAALLTPFIIKAAEGISGLTGTESSAMDELKGWNYDMNKDLSAPLIFEFFTDSFIKNLLSDELGELFSDLPGLKGDYYIYRILRTGPDEWVDDIATAEKETLDAIILRSYRECISVLSERFGDIASAWKWGDIHTLTIGHPLASVKILDRIFKLNSVTYRAGGSNHTVSPYSFSKDYKVDHGASERHIFNTANWDESLTIIPTGNSGIPASEFYLSQTENYVCGKMYKDHFTENAVRSNAKYKLVLRPE